jgi:hypothetical protein
LKGFDLLRGKYVNDDNEMCHFKILQVVTKEKDKEEDKTGEATISDSGITIVKRRPGRQQTNPVSPFSPATTTSNAHVPQHPMPVTSSGNGPTPQYQQPTNNNMEQQQIADLQARLEASLRLAADNEAAAKHAVAQSQSMEQAARQAVAQQHAAAQAAIAQSQSMAKDQTNAQQQQLVHIHAALEEARAKEQAAIQAAAQQQAAAHDAIAQSQSFAQNHTNAQQQEMARMLAALEEARAREQAATQAAAQQQAAAREAIAQSVQYQAQLAVTEQRAVGAQSVQQENVDPDRAAVEIARARVKRARFSEMGQGFSSLRAAAQQALYPTKTTNVEPGLHGSDGYHPGVPAYVDGQQSATAEEDTEDMSTIDGGNSFANAGMSIGHMSFN